MYYPYFRGKQYELIAIRENAALLKQSGFVPIIEPVKQPINSLRRAIDEVKRVGGECVLIINPQYGDHSQDSKAIRLLAKTYFAAFDGLSVGILLTASTSLDYVKALCSQHAKRNLALIHCGFEDGKDLAGVLAECPNVTRHVFVEDFCGKLYRRHFADRTRILVRDGFRKQRTNREYGDAPEPFSDLHATFRDEEGMDGFGDFLIVGDDYSESGGPAYAVAIHLTYIDEQKDGEMSILHFVSKRTDTQTDPAGKFGEALAKLVAEVEKANSPILRSPAVVEYLELHSKQHFPGLGYVKKLSMQHHIETLADYFARQ